MSLKVSKFQNEFMKSSFLPKYDFINSFWNLLTFKSLSQFEDSKAIKKLPNNWKNLLMGYWFELKKKTFQICSKCFFSEWNHIYYWNVFNFFVLGWFFFPIFYKGTIFETKYQSAIVLMYSRTQYTYHKVASSRPVYCSIFEHFWGATY